MGDEQKQCSLCNILASFSGRNDQGDEISAISSSMDSCGGENSVEEVKERRSKQKRSKQMKKTSSKVKSNPAVIKNGKTGSAAKQQLSDVKKDGQSGAQTLDDQAEDSNQIEKPLTDFQKKLAKKTDNEKPTGGFKIKRYGSNGKAKVACAAAAGNAPRSFADAVRGWGSARGGGGGPGLSARMAAVGEEAEEAPAPFEGGGGGGGGDNEDSDAVFLDPQLREEMLDFARCHFVLEMALFLVAVHDFSKLCTEHIEDEPTARQCHVEKAFEKYCDIVDEFIRQNSNHEINISHKMRASVMRFNRLGKKSFAAAPAFETRTIFKEPFEEVKKLFYTNYIVRFT